MSKLVTATAHSEIDSTSVLLCMKLERRSIPLDALLSRDQTLSYNRMQSRAVTGRLTRHNALRRNLCITRLTDSSSCGCGAEEETSAHVVRRPEALATLTHTHVDSFLLGPKNVRNLSLGVI